jgi:hypothetical protein
MEDGIVYGHLVCFTVIWYILWPFGVFYTWLLGIFSLVWYLVPRKIWQPWLVGDPETVMESNQMRGPNHRDRPAD